MVKRIYTYFEIYSDAHSNDYFDDYSENSGHVPGLDIDGYHPSSIVFTDKKEREDNLNKQKKDFIKQDIPHILDLILDRCIKIIEVEKESCLKDGFNEKLVNASYNSRIIKFKKGGIL